LYNAALVFSGGLIYLYFKGAGVSDLYLLVSYSFWPISALAALLVMNGRPKIDVRPLMALGSLTYVATFALLFLLPPTKELLFAYWFITGISCLLFWIPFNIMYFELAQRRAATLGTAYNSIGPLLSLVLPLASGYVAQAFGFSALFIASAIVFLIPAAAAFLLGPREFSYDLAGSLRELKGFKSLIFLEGLGTSSAAVVISIAALSYFSQPVDLALYISVTTLFSVIASFAVSRVSDRAMKRKAYITLFGCLAALSTIAAAFSPNVLTWYATTGLRGFFLALFMPFTTAILVDSRRDMGKIMVGRDWILGLGRLFGVAFTVAAYLISSSIFVSLAAVSWVLVLYPVIIELKRRHISVA
jgi:MFS family permease